MAKYLSKQTQEIFTRVLTTKDYAEVADESGFSYSTVNNVINRRTKLNGNNQKIVDCLNRMAKKRIDQITKLKNKL